jgi:GDP-L-fucose synthase
MEAEQLPLNNSKATDSTKILLLGNGLVGSAIKNQLQKISAFTVITVNTKDYDLGDISAVHKMFETHQPNLCILAAGFVGGIEKNMSNPTELIFLNTRIILNVIESLPKFHVQYFINLVPACVYPSNLHRPAVPKDLFSSPMDSSSLPYSTAKIASIVMVNALRDQNNANYMSLISTNVYGDNVEIETHKAHVIPALINKFTEAKKLKAKSVTLLGDGTPIREFLHADDLATAVLKVICDDLFQTNILNVAGGESVTIARLAELVKKVTGYSGEVVFSNSEKNGTLVKLIDGSELIGYGWKPAITLKQGLERAYFAKNIGQS